MSYKKVLAGYNDLATLNPELAAQWHPTLNEELTPQMVTVSSDKRAWWLCDEGHEWEARVSSRSKGNGCPFCSGRQSVPGFNDLATLNPSLAAQWHPTLNGELTPQMVTNSSSKRAWWLCDEGHEWEAVISSRSAGHGCPFCSGNKALAGFNDLATINPKLAAEWHPTKNGELTPKDITQGSESKAWWLCDKGHEWNAIIHNRTVGSGCRFCGQGHGGKHVLAGFNDLATLNPSLAAQWHPTKNRGLTPQEVTRACNKKAWWLCSTDSTHEWEAQISNRSKGTSCPFCVNKRVLAGYNDLATRNPKVAAQWHPTLNEELTPQMVMPGCKQKAWWLCDKGHEWEAIIHNRAVGSGCPICAGRKVKNNSSVKGK